MGLGFRKLFAPLRVITAVGRRAVLVKMNEMMGKFLLISFTVKSSVKEFRKKSLVCMGAC